MYYFEKIESVSYHFGGGIFGLSDVREGLHSFFELSNSSIEFTNFATSATSTLLNFDSFRTQKQTDFLSVSLSEKIDGDDDDNTLVGTDEDDEINGFAGDDQITGLAGNDIIDGGDGNDQIDGGEGNDTIIGGGGEDFINGNDGDDTISSGVGYVFVQGGAGDDTFTGIIRGSGEVYGEEGNDTLNTGGGNYLLFGGNGNDTINGGDLSDSLFGDEGNDVLRGGGGDDFLESGADFPEDSSEGVDSYDEFYGEAGNDQIRIQGDRNFVDGGTGDDIIVIQGGRSGELIGGDGIDTVLWEAFDVVDFEIDLSVGIYRSNDLSIDYAISGVENVSGSTGDDIITGDENDNRLNGVRGNDVIRAGAGDDVVVISISIDNQEDGPLEVGQYFGGDGTDTLATDAGRSFLGISASLISQTGSFFNSYIDSRGIPGTRELTFTLSEFENLDLGTGGVDILIGNDSDNILTSRQGLDEDIIFVDTVEGNGGNDIIRAQAAGNFSGGEGNDTFEIFENFISRGASAIFREDGLHIDIGQGLIIEDGFGHTGTVTGFENVISTNFDDIIVGSDDDNHFFARRGDDQIDGGDGNDTLQVESEMSSFFFIDGPEGELVLLDVFNSDGIKRLSNIEFIEFGDGQIVSVDDLPRMNIDLETAILGEFPGFGSQGIGSINDGMGRPFSFDINGTGDADVIFGLANPNDIFAGDGDDIVYAGHSRDTVHGEAGDDMLFAGDGQLVTVSRFVNIIRETTIENLGDTLDGGEGNDELFGRDGGDTLVGGPGNDTLFGNSGDDRLDAGSGFDLVFGGDGNDFIEARGGFIDFNNNFANVAGGYNVFGEAGNDTIFAGALFESAVYSSVDGGAGEDTVQVNENTTILENFDGTYNLVEINRLNPEPIQTRIATLTDVEFITILDSNSNDVVTLTIEEAAENILSLNDGGDTYGASENVELRVQGGDGNDVIQLAEGFDQARGHDGDDVIRLAGGDDLGLGDAGNDRVEGESGNDQLFGGAGNDLLFGDAARSLSLESAEGELFRAYEAVFDRAPDPGGFNAFLTEIRLGNTTQEEVIEEFVASVEFENTYGSLDNEGFVRQLFLNVLDREGDAGGIEAFTDALDGGRSRASVVIDFANSAEFVQLMTLPSAAFATNVIINPAEGQVFRIYQAVFLRDPDEAGFTAFTNSIQAGVLTVEEITAEFVASEEFQLTYGDLDNADFVELLFTNVLPGNMDSQGRADFTEALDAGTLTRETMVAEFVETFEFVQRMESPAADFVSGVFTNSGDTLDGGAGNDILFGGRGADEFVFDTQDGGADIILDFTSGTDSLDLGVNVDFDTFAEIMAAGTQAGLDVVFDFGDGNTLTLEGVTLSELTESDFGFDDTAGNSKPSDAATAVVTPFPLAEAEIVADIADFEIYDMFG